MVIFNSYVKLPEGIWKIPLNTFEIKHVPLKKMGIP